MKPSLLLILTILISSFQLKSSSIQSPSTSFYSLRNYDKSKTLVGNSSNTDKGGSKSITSIPLPFPQGTTTTQKLSTSLIVDNNGRKWVGSKYGVIYYKNGSWSQFYNVASNSLPSNEVTCLHQAGNDIVVGTANGIAIYNGSTWQIYNSSNTIMQASEVVNDISSYYGKLYIATNHGIYTKNGNIWSVIKPSNSQLPDSLINNIEISPSGEIWVASTKGITRVTGSNYTHFNTANNTLPGNNVKSVIVDNNNNTWITIVDQGIFKLVNSTFVNAISLYKPYQWELYTNHFLIKLPSGGVGSSSNIGFIELGQDFKFYVSTSYRFYGYENDTLWNIGSFAENLEKIVNEPKDIQYSLNYLDTNNLYMGLANTGMLFWQNEELSLSKTPKTGNLTTLYCGNLWVGGKDANNDLRIVGDIYQPIGRDWSVGPIMDPAYQDSEIGKWNKVWKISKAEIDYHNSHWWTAGYIAPNSILSWPGDGDTLKGQMNHVAPYHDINANGKYDPLNGDYPVIRGDQALFFIFNDMTNDHISTGGEKLGVEIHAMAYEFYKPSDSALQNTMFLNYRIFNRSQNNYHDLYISSFTDIDIGKSNDDKIGCDTNLSAIFGYNGDNYDGSAMYPDYYGNKPPAMGVTYLNQEMSSVIPILDYPTPFFPESDTDFYNYQKATWNDGTHLCYGGFGHPTLGSTSTPCNFAFPGELGNNSQWTDLQSNTPGERRILVNFGPFNFPSGASACYDIAYTYARDYQDTLFYSSVSILKQRIEQIQDFYDNNISQNCLDYNTSLPELQLLDDETLKIYPNPASRVVIVETSSTDEKTVTISDISGKNIISLKMTNKEIIDLTPLPSGIYIITIKKGESQISSKIVKQ